MLIEGGMSVFCSIICVFLRQMVSQKCSLWQSMSSLQVFFSVDGDGNITSEQEVSNVTRPELVLKGVE